MQKKLAVGIDDMAAYIPNLYLPIADLAAARELEYAKLNKGLGLTSMSVPDQHEDAATMAANAVLRLMLQNGLKPEQIGRIYLGTESSVDGSKPMSTYVLDMLNQYFEAGHGKQPFLHCDVVDLTFACIGAVDALQNTLDWVQGGSQRIGIVVGSDIARYELESGGEYTQGAGAVALLVRQSPRLLVMDSAFGVATKPVHDFFKPLRHFTKAEIITEVLQLAGVNGIKAATVLENLKPGDANSLLHHFDAAVEVHRDTPVFDGPYSNNCYQERIWEALEDYTRKSSLPEDEAVTDEWYRLVFHLPYAYQARRMFAEIFMRESQKRGDWGRTAQHIAQPFPQPGGFQDPAAYQKALSKYYRAITKTERYQRFVAEKIEKGERVSSLVGNLYTSSLFLSLMSTLEADLEEQNALTGRKVGFFAYGSGSKSKVFSATVAEGWETVTRRFGLARTLQQRQAIDYTTYERLHRGQTSEPVQKPSAHFYLKEISREPGTREGARAYGWRGKVEETVSKTAS